MLSDPHLKEIRIWLNRLFLSPCTEKFMRSAKALDLPRRVRLRREHEADSWLEVLKILAAVDGEEDAESIVEKWEVALVEMKTFEAVPESARQYVLIEIVAWRTRDLEGRGSDQQRRFQKAVHYQRLGEQKLAEIVVGDPIEYERIRARGIESLKGLE